MAQDATGTPTAKGIPKINTAIDAPSGKGFNAAMDVIDGLLTTSAVSQTLIDAKGDLIAGTAADTAGRLAVGANATVLTADSAEATGLKWAASGGGVPAGALLAYGASTPPSGWLMCDGASIDTTTYAALFAVLGYKYGGAGASFNVPDMRGRVPVGKGTHADVDTVGENDGSALADRRPKHKHTVTSNISHGGGGGSSHLARQAQFADYGAIPADSVGPQTNAPTDAPAYLVHDYIIKT